MTLPKKVCRCARKSARAKKAVEHRHSLSVRPEVVATLEGECDPIGIVVRSPTSSIPSIATVTYESSDSHVFSDSYAAALAVVHAQAQQDALSPTASTTSGISFSCSHMSETSLSSNAPSMSLADSSPSVTLSMEAAASTDVWKLQMGRLDVSSGVAHLPLPACSDAAIQSMSSGNDHEANPQSSQVEGAGADPSSGLFAESPLAVESAHVPNLLVGVAALISNAESLKVAHAELVERPSSAQRIPQRCRDTETCCQPPIMKLLRG